MRPSPPPDAKRLDAYSSKKALNLIGPKFLDKEIAKGSTIVILVARKITNDAQEQTSSAAVPILKEFVDVFPEELPNNLLPMSDI